MIRLIVLIGFALVLVPTGAFAQEDDDANADKRTGLYSSVTALVAWNTEDEDQGRDDSATAGVDLAIGLQRQTHSIGARFNLMQDNTQVSAGLDGNTAFMNTPTFGYRLTIALDPKSTAHVEWSREITGITQTDIILDDEVSQLIGEHYQETCFQAMRPISIAVSVKM